MKNGQGSRYFVELVIVVVFLCILAAIVIPHLKDLFH